MQSMHRASHALAAAALMLCAVSCAEPGRTPTVVPDSYGASAPAPAGQTLAQAPKRHYRDTNGQLYYVDEKGALHTVYQGRSVVRDTEGGYYYPEDEAGRTYRDESGTLYYLDKNGKVLLTEDDAPGRPVDPLPLLRGTDTERKAVAGMRQGECARMLQECLAGCATRPGEAERQACYDSCERTRAICGKGN